eukprot:scaffold213143_cov23-Tisochrysis_lutea.AAC.1
MARDVYLRFGVRLDDLRRFVQTLELPAGWRLHGGHVMRGEEAVLITLRRFRTAGEWRSSISRLGDGA